MHPILPLGSLLLSPDFIDALAEAVAAKIALMIGPMATNATSAPSVPDADMTVADVAKLLRFSEKHVRELIKAGVLRGHDRNKGMGLRAVWRISKRDVEVYRKTKR